MQITKSFFIYIFAICLFFSSLQSYSQNKIPFNCKTDIALAKWLVGSGQYGLMLDLSARYQTNTCCSATVDSLHFYTGWAAYNLKKLDFSTQELLLVSANSPFYRQSQFFSGYNYLYNKQLDSAKCIFNNLYKSNDSLIKSLVEFEYAGMYLLKRDTFQYSCWRSKLDDANYYYHSDLVEFDNVFYRYSKFNQKSVWLAGLMSAIVPGSGKIYAGRLGEGLSALATNGILAAIVLENYSKNGLNDYKTIIYGSLFSIFYIGNIYGSMVSVKVYRNEFYQMHENAVLLHLQLPLRNFFNQ
jgi:hypothetical protein